MNILDKGRYRINLLYLFIIFAIVGNLCLIDNYHQWGDDFSLYLNQAKSLVNGSYNDLYNTNKDVMDHGKAGPYLYPIGYPVLISPFFKLSEFNFIYFKLFNYAIYLIGMYFFCKITILLKIKKEMSLVTIIALLLSPLFFWHHNNIVSDIPSFTLNLICIYLYLKVINDDRLYSTLNLYLIVLSLFMAFTIFTRTANISLLFSMLFVSFIKFLVLEKKTKTFILHYFYLTITTIFLFFLNRTFPLNRGENEMKVLLETNVFQTLSHHLPYYIELITDPFTVLINPLVKGAIDHTSFYLYKDYSKLICIILISLKFGFLLVRFIVKKGIKHIFHSINELFIFVFLLATIAIYLIWPSTQGHRFVFVVYPFFFLFLFSQILTFSPRINKAILVITILFVCYDGYRILKFNVFTKNEGTNVNESESRPGSKDFNNMMVYMKDSVYLEPNKVIATNKPRLIYFFTGKKAYLQNTSSQKYIQYLFIREAEEEDSTILIGDIFFLKKRIGTLFLYETNYNKKYAN